MCIVCLVSVPKAGSKPAGGSCPCAETQARPWDPQQTPRDPSRQHWLSGSPPSLSQTSEKHHCDHWPGSITCKKCWHSSEFRVHCLFQKENLEIGYFHHILSLRPSMSSGYLNWRPCPASGITDQCCSWLCYSQFFPQPSCDKMQHILTYYPAWLWRARPEIAQSALHDVLWAVSLVHLYWQTSVHPFWLLNLQSWPLHVGPFSVYAFVSIPAPVWSVGAGEAHLEVCMNLSDLCSTFFMDSEWVMVLTGETLWDYAKGWPNLAHFSSLLEDQKDLVQKHQIRGSKPATDYLKAEKHIFLSTHLKISKILRNIKKKKKKKKS